MFLLITNYNICRLLNFKYIVAQIPGPCAAASHRRTAWHGDHGMAWFDAHRRARRGAADLIQSCSLSDYCTAEGRRGPKSKVPEDTSLLAQVILWGLKELLLGREASSTLGSDGAPAAPFILKLM